MEWHDIAMPVGSPDRGFIGIDATLRLPDCDSDQPATDRQLEALLMFYSRDFPGITGTQAHALLCARDFSLACAKTIWPKWNDRLRVRVAAGLAAFVMADDRIRQFAISWSDGAYKRGSANPRGRGGPVFPEVQAFADYLAGMLEMEGWTDEILRSDRFR